MADELIYLFTGTSEIFIKNRIDRIIQSYSKYKISITKYDMEITSLSHVLTDAITIPMLEDYKFIILRHPKFLSSTKTDMTPEVKEFIKYLKKPVESTVLMIDATNINIPSNNEIYKALKNFAMIINYSESEEIEVRGWVVRTLATHNIEIKDDALVLFMEYLNNDQVRMGTELNKLISYLGAGGVVTVSVIKEMVSKDSSKLIYSLVNAIVAQDNNLINNLYQELSSNTKDITGIISIVTNTFKELFTTLKLLQSGYTQSDIAKFYGISTNFAYYKVKDAKTFKITDLEKQVRKLAELDYLIKSGQIDKNLGFELFLIK